MDFATTIKITINEKNLANLQASILAIDYNHYPTANHKGISPC